MTAGEVIRQYIKPEYQKDVRVFTSRRGLIERLMWPCKKSTKIRKDEEVFIQVIK